VIIEAFLFVGRVFILHLSGTLCGISGVSCGYQGDNGRSNWRLTTGGKIQRMEHQKCQGLWHPGREP